MKKHLQYVTQGTCSKMIMIDVENETIIDVDFLGGCHGNTQGIAALVAGMNINEAIGKLEGINCSGRGTSCPDQLAKALRSIKTAGNTE